jgi:hypothetical protein
LVETGATVNITIIASRGDKIKIDTATSLYMEQVKNNFKKKQV